MADNIIAKFVLALGFDAKEYHEGSAEARKSFNDLKDDTVKSAKEMERQGKNAAQAFATLKREAMALLAVFTAGVGLKSFTENTINSAVSLGQQSKNLNMAISDLEAYKRANDRAGGSAEGMVAFLSEAQARVARKASGHDAGVGDFFWNRGGQEEDLLSTEAYVKRVANILKESDRVTLNQTRVTPNQTRNIAHSLGVSDEALSLMRKGSAEVYRLREESRKFNKYTEEDAQKALSWRGIWHDIEDEFTRTSVKILFDLEPSIRLLLDGLQKVGAWVKEHQGDIEKWVGNFNDKLPGVIKDIAALAEKLFLVAKAFGLVSGVIIDQTPENNKDKKEPEKKKGIIDRVLQGMGYDEQKTLDIMNEGKYQNSDQQTKSEKIRKKEKELGLPAGSLDAVWSNESSRGTNTSKPELGEFGIVPTTARDLGLTPKDVQDFDKSLDAAARYLKQNLKKEGGNLDAAFFDYNQGPNAPKPTGSLKNIEYVKRANAEMQKTQDKQAKGDVNLMGPITIMTNAKDGKELYASMQKEWPRWQGVTAQANTGLT